jgi:ribosomal RNA-processing protein 1
MTDRPLPQQALARDLAALLHRLRLSAADPWLRGFWAVLGAQWTDIDVLRMEKFLLLVRRVFAAQLAWAAAGGSYDAKRVEVVVGVMRDWCFDAECDLRRVPVGLRLHVLDLWVDELEREGVLTEEGGVAAGAEALVAEMKTMVDALRACPVKPVRERARESFEDERLPWVEKEKEDEDEEMNGQKGAGSDDDSDGWGGIDD